MSNLPAIEQFDCNGEPCSLGIRWEKWKRAFQIYLSALGISESIKKRAILLHTGGIALQEIFYNIPGAYIDENSQGNEEKDVFDVALEKLDLYFSPKQSKIYERHLFRLLKQEDDEKFEKFLVRLRHQADKCKFTDVDSNLIDQITEKCKSKELRRKILSLGDNITLSDIILEATALESVNLQMERFESPNTSNSNISLSDINQIHTRQTNKVLKKYNCGRCGSSKHNSNDSTCPAKDKVCHKCQKIGHFRQFCRSKTTFKRSYNTTGNNERHYKRTRRNSDDDTDKVNYIFHIDDDDYIACKVGGVELKMIIDSGSKSNIIGQSSWEKLKSNKIKVTNQVKKPNKTFMSYANKETLSTLGCFDAEIEIGLRKEKATFYVIKNGSKCLLGKTTAKLLGVLKTGLDINAIASPFPKIKGVILDIPIDENVKPVIQPYRRIPIPLEEKVEKALQELLDLDIIETVNGPSKWISPIVPVLKSNGDVRICVDMRRANQAISRENHPLPTMDTLLSQLREANLFSRLDIKNAFHQLEISENSRHITTFISKKGLLRYKRLMFGLTCAPEMFQKTMEKILITCKGVVVFIDDIVIFGKDEIEHEENLQKVLTALKEHGVLLNETKCVYRVKSIEFLGHTLSNSGIKPLSRHVTAVKNFRKPKNIEEIQSFLGLVNFVGKWIPHLSTISEPIRILLRKKLSKHADIMNLWGKSQEEAFEKIKNLISQDKYLGYYDPKHKTQVIADASPVGLGCVLIQYGKNGPHIIAYGHKSLTECERRYCQTEKEALALVWVVEHFHMYLYGMKEFELITDHKPLEVIFGPKSKPCARIERWVLRLQSYTFKVIYRPGKTNIADPFSRLCHNENDITPTNNEEYISSIVEYSRPIAASLEEIKHNSKVDPEIKSVRDGIFNNIWKDKAIHYRPFESEMCFHGDILLRSTKIVIPEKLRQRVLDAAHEGHPGIVSIKKRLRTKVWWPKIDADAEKSVKHCRGCTLVAAPNPPHPMKRRELPTQPWIDVAIDFMGPLPSGDYLFVIIDYYSRYKDVKIMRTITSENTIKILREIFSRLGSPVSITADNGRQFVSKDFKEFCKEHNIVLYNTIPYWPQMNGEVERQNRDILKRLKISHGTGKNWRSELQNYLTMYNSTPHSTTGKTPSELFFNRQFKDKIPSLQNTSNEVIEGEVRDRDCVEKMKGKVYGDKKRKAETNHHNLDYGDKVLVKNIIKDNKLTPNFDNTTHTVTNASGGDIEIQNDQTGQIQRRNIVHLKKVDGQWEVCPKETKRVTTDHSC